MGTDNVSKAGLTPVATPELSAPNINTLTLPALTPAALYAPSFQPLYTSVDPSVQYPVLTRPAPFTLSASSASLAANPAQLTTSLQSGSSALDSAISDLDQQMTDAQNKLIADEKDPNASAATLQQDAQKLQELMMKFQILTTLQSNLENMIANAELKALDNSKLQG